jgi:hypothetical protein
LCEPNAKNVRERDKNRRILKNRPVWDLVGDGGQAE